MNKSVDIVGPAIHLPRAPAMPGQTGPCCTNIRGKSIGRRQTPQLSNSHPSDECSGSSSTTFWPYIAKATQFLGKWPSFLSFFRLPDCHAAGSLLYNVRVVYTSSTTGSNRLSPAHILIETHGHNDG